MTHKLLPAIALVLFFGLAAENANAKYPVLSLFTGRSDGPYQPAPRRYTVVDPVPVAPTYPVGPHGHAHSGAARHAAEVAAQNAPQWRKHDAVTPVYPYGWFGARHASERQTRGSYYDDYNDTAIIRGR
jgi:hypothetical protein